MDLSILRDLERWMALDAAGQDAIVREVAGLLGETWVFQETRNYDPTRLGLRIATFLHRDTGLHFNLIPGGSYMMGLSEDEEAAMEPLTEEGMYSVGTMRPVHPVRVEPFLVTRLPILADFARKHAPEDAFSSLADVLEGPGEVALLAAGGIDLLVERCGFPLPSEAQWEYACRGGTCMLFYFDADIVARYHEDADLERRLEAILRLSFGPHEDLSLAWNPFGLAGLFTGERCADDYRPNYIGARADDLPLLDPMAPTHVARGGGALSWPWQGVDEWVECASAYRRSEVDSLDGGAACRFVRRLPL